MGNFHRILLADWMVNSASRIKHLNLKLCGTKYGFTYDMVWWLVGTRNIHHDYKIVFIVGTRLVPGTWLTQLSGLVPELVPDIDLGIGLPPTWLPTCREIYCHLFRKSHSVGENWIRENVNFTDFWWGPPNIITTFEWIQSYPIREKCNRSAVNENILGIKQGGPKFYQCVKIDFLSHVT